MTTSHDLSWNETWDDVPNTDEVPDVSPDFRFEGGDYFQDQEGECQLMRLDCGDEVVVEVVLADDGTVGHAEVGRALMACPLVGQPQLVPAGWVRNHFMQLLMEGDRPDLKTVVRGE